MPLSTSHSNRIPRFAFAALAVMLAAWSLAALYTLRLNPEISFFKHAYLSKREWSRKLARNDQPKFVIFGGSSCGTSVNAARMLTNHHLPVVNMGLGAAFGAEVLTQFALSELRPGDTLIVALEPELLAGAGGLQTLGIQCSFAVGHPEFAIRAGASWPSALLSLRPGAYHCFTLLGKILFRQPLLSYSKDEIQPGGWHAVAARRNLPEPDVPVVSLSPHGRDLLRRIREYCVAHRIRVAYSLPWMYVPPQNEADAKAGFRTFLEQISAIIPVLNDAALGTHTIKDDFADTVFHLKSEAANLRTDEIARALRHWDVLTTQDLP